MKSPLMLCLAALVVTTACNPPSAEDLVQNVMEIRRNYDATLGSWILNSDGPEPYLYLDVMVVNNNGEASLSTLTVLVEQLDLDDEDSVVSVLDSRRVVLDVTAMTAGIGQSVGVEVRPAHLDVEGVRLVIEARPERDAWREFPELDAVRPRI